MTALLVSGSVFAHCDGLDGPVVKVAREALETGNVNLVLIWVKKDDEAAIEKAFRQALAVRKLSAEAKDMADMYFFETLVRILGGLDAKSAANLFSMACRPEASPPAETHARTSTAS